MAEGRPHRERSHEHLRAVTGERRRLHVATAIEHVEEALSYLEKGRRSRH